MPVLKSRRSGVDLRAHPAVKEYEAMGAAKQMAIAATRKPRAADIVANVERMVVQQAAEIERLRVTLRCISQRASYGQRNAALKEIREWADAALTQNEQGGK